MSQATDWWGFAKREQFQLISIGKIIAFIPNVCQRGPKTVKCCTVYA